MSYRLRDKVAVITGGASGIGAATVRLFLSEGAAVVFGDIQESRGAALAAELGPCARFVPADVSREADVQTLVLTAIEQFGQLDIMFNNAGVVGITGPIDEISLSDYEQTMAILLRSVFLGMKHAAAVMKPQESGVILSTSSIAGVVGGLGPHVYAAAKSAILGLTRNVAAELGPWGVRVAAIVPGNHATPLTARALLGDSDALEETIDVYRRESPLHRRPGLAEDVAHAALWLASDDAGYVTGTSLVVDGGLTTGSKKGAQRWSGHIDTAYPASAR